MPDVALAKTEPAGRGHFLLSKELHALFALHVQVAEKRIVPSIKRKPRHGSGNSDIDPHHSALDAVFEFSRRFAGPRKYRSTVAIRRTIRRFDRRFQIVKT